MPKWLFLCIGGAFFGVLVIRALPFRVYLRAPDFLEFTYSPCAKPQNPPLLAYLVSPPSIHGVATSSRMLGSKGKSCEETQGLEFYTSKFKPACSKQKPLKLIRAFCRLLVGVWWHLCLSYQFQTWAVVNILLSCLNAPA